MDVTKIAAALMFGGGTPPADKPVVRESNAYGTESSYDTSGAKNTWNDRKHARVADMVGMLIRDSATATSARPPDGSDISTEMRTVADYYGGEAARKFMTHLYLFNEDPSMKRLSPEERMRAFTSKKTGDPKVDEIIGNIGAFAGGLDVASRKDNLRDKNMLQMAFKMANRTTAKPDSVVTKEQYDNAITSNR